MDYPFYLVDHCCPGDAIRSLAHVVVSREEEGKKDLESRIASSTFPFWLSVLDAFIQKNKIKVQGKIKRICINGTVAANVPVGEYHTDHNEPYKHLLVYLNDTFTGSARTIIKNDDDTIQYIEPKKFRGAYFTECMHTLEYPESGIRLLAVFTFD